MTTPIKMISILHESVYKDLIKDDPILCKIDVNGIDYWNFHIKFNEDKEFLEFLYILEKTIPILLPTLNSRIECSTEVDIPDINRDAFTSRIIMGKVSNTLIFTDFHGKIRFHIETVKPYDVMIHLLNFISSRLKKEKINLSKKCDITIKNIEKLIK